MKNVVKIKIMPIDAISRENFWCLNISNFKSRKRQSEEEIVNIPVRRHSSEPDTVKNFDKLFNERVNSTKSKNPHKKKKKYIWNSLSCLNILEFFFFTLTVIVNNKGDFFFSFSSEMRIFDL